jgi:hypothetical protein
MTRKSILFEKICRILTLLAAIAVPAGGCAKGGEAEDGFVETDFDLVEGERELYWEDTVYPDGPEFGLGTRDGWQVSQDGVADLSCAIKNDCDGCAPLEGTPGSECDACGGVWECNGVDAVICVGGCDSIGCSDGEREGFTDMDLFPDIAGCGGAWTVEGLINPDSGGIVTPKCGLMAGDDSAFNPEGFDCSASDLCANGWRLCASPVDVSERTRGWGNGCGTDADWPPASFYAAAVSGTGESECSFGINDIFGCGSAGDGADRSTCFPLTKYSDDDCDALPSTWDCGEGYITGNLEEAAQVTKTGIEGGGVLCCRERS